MLVGREMFESEKGYYANFDFWPKHRDPYGDTVVHVVDVSKTLPGHLEDRTQRLVLTLALVLLIHLCLKRWPAATTAPDYSRQSSRIYLASW